MSRLSGDQPGLAAHHDEGDDDELFETSSSVSGGESDDDEDRFSDGGAEDGGDQDHRRYAPQPVRRMNSDSLYDMSSVMAQLPVQKGLSRYYEGKSQSFACMSEVRCLEDLRKKESPYKQKIKSCKSYVALGGIAKKPSSSCANLSLMAANGFRAPPIPGKSGRGLRQFSMKVCEKVESKGRTTYNEVADELVAEFSDPNNSIESPDPDNPNAQQYDEKNIRRRVYDALNVLMAMDIISKDKKEIQWKGLPRTSINDIEELKTELVGLKGRIEKKSAYLQELQDQYVGMQNLIQRNEQLYGSENTPSGGVALPFILIQTRPHATVEVEISEDMQLVHFDFNSTPFELHDDSYVLKAMGSSGKEKDDGTQEPSSNGGESSSMPNIYRHLVQQPARANNGTTRLPSSPPIPGILKGRVKHEH